MHHLQCDVFIVQKIAPTVWHCLILNQNTSTGNLTEVPFLIVIMYMYIHLGQGFQLASNINRIQKARSKKWHFKKKDTMLLQFKVCALLFLLVLNKLNGLTGLPLIPQQENLSQNSLPRMKYTLLGYFWERVTLVCKMENKGLDSIYMTSTAVLPRTIVLV